MLHAVCPQVWGDLVSTRRRAAVFLDNLDAVCGATNRRTWIAKWIKIGDTHCFLCDLNLSKGASAEAAEAWLSALTAFEVARRLLDENDQQSEEVSARVESVILRFGPCLEQKLEEIQIAGCDETECSAYFLPAGGPNLCSPPVICISREEETRATLLGRLLPAVIGRSISVLIVSHEDVTKHGHSETFLSCCLDFLSSRLGVDDTRVGVYGEGLSAVLATDFATSDERVAAAVCDGGLWSWARNLASVGWMTRSPSKLHEDALSVRRSRLARQMGCPVLVVAGGRGTVSVSEAIKLQAECRASCIDLEVMVARMVRAPVGEIENFVSSDDYIFGWLEHKLAAFQGNQH
ncbi:hypothetical protein JIR23_06610 [Bradyrhizobium diazoefficiens]|nr:hypothetical protein [Bradyrhizobium diazoefficiens]QQN65429.1 hypothetical protein JIR23_06610 [Bradyrhizobium diazoefficiens]